MFGLLNTNTFTQYFQTSGKLQIHVANKMFLGCNSALPVLPKILKKSKYVVKRLFQAKCDILPTFQLAFR